MWDGLLSPTGVVSAVGVIAVGLAVTLTGVVKTLREAVADLRGRVEDLTKERDDLEEKHNDCKAQLVERDRDLEAIGKVITGEAHLVAIENALRDSSSQSTENHRQAMAAWERITVALRDVQRHLEER